MPNRPCNVAVLRWTRQSDPNRIQLSTFGLRLDNVPHGLHLLIAALYSHAVAIWESPRGEAACAQYLRFMWPALLETHDDRVAFFVPTFTRLIKAKSPLIIIDEHMPPLMVGAHIRGRWRLPHVNFDPRSQVLMINDWLIRSLLDSHIRAVDHQNPQSEFAFHLECLKVVQTLCHELGHLFTTFLGRGGRTTPPNARAANSDFPHLPDPSRSQGDAGDFFERALFGGAVVYWQDNAPYGRLAFPYIRPDAVSEYRAVKSSITDLMRGRMPSLHSPALQCSDLTLLESHKWSMERSQLTQPERDGRVTVPPEARAPGLPLIDCGRDTPPGEINIQLPDPFPVHRGLDYNVGVLRRVVSDPFAGLVRHIR